MRFSYQMQKFSDARRALMLPHHEGEDRSIAQALFECLHGLRDLDRSHTDGDAMLHLKTLDEFMDTTGLSDPQDRGLYLIKAANLTIDDRLRLAETIDELASYFSRVFWTTNSDR